ncbi:MAG: transcription termination/antitermination protein NusG [Alphaproteobacteria bacterium CG1_02_46_17]|nr:MAG: transcription termination/antitermination protein NusG [Alphaproteobacteria bacterium CG1_02_46_17]
MAARWYVLHVYSGFEGKVAEAIRDKALKQGIEERIEEILIPTEEIVEIKRGQRINSEQKIFPGYVLAKMDLSDEVWHMVKNTPKVTGFLGAGNRPSPISEKEAARLMTQLKEGIDKPRSAIIFDIGEKVKVMEGPFASFEGMVEEVDEDKGRLKVSVSIFGRATPVDLEYAQVEKV